METEKVSNLMFPKRPAATETRFVVSLVLATAMILTLSTGSWATLFDRGEGLVYDDVLDISWLQDANLAAANTFGVSGINADGTMSWNTAQAWIAAMKKDNGGRGQWGTLMKIITFSEFSFSQSPSPV